MTSQITQCEPIHNNRSARHRLFIAMAVEGQTEENSLEIVIAGRTDVRSTTYPSFAKKSRAVVVSRKIAGTASLRLFNKP